MEIGMHPKDLLVRCLAEYDGHQWTAVSLEFGLAVQGESFEEVKSLLDSQIRSYLHDALVGEDRAHARYLLTRRAPVSAFLKWYSACFQCWIDRKLVDHHERRRKLFTEALRMQPA